MFCIVNLLTKRPFQPEAPCDGDDVVVVTSAIGEPSKIEEIAEDQIQARSPHKGAEADVDAGRAEV
jgi:hypothetical protein